MKRRNSIHFPFFNFSQGLRSIRELKQFNNHPSHELPSNRKEKGELEVAQELEKQIKLFKNLSKESQPSSIMNFSEQLQVTRKSLSTINSALCHSQLEEIKKLLENYAYRKVVKSCDTLIEALKKVSLNAEDSTLIQALAQAYTYKGIALSVGTREQEDQALACLEGALKLLPDYETPKQLIKSIQLERGILPEGETLEFVDEINNSTIDKSQP